MLGKLSRSERLGSRELSSAAQGNCERIKKEGSFLSLVGGVREIVIWEVLPGLNLEIQVGILQIDLIREALKVEGTA